MSTKDNFEEWGRDHRREIWRPKHNPMYGGWYIEGANLSCFPFDYPRNWPNQGAVQMLCDLHNLEVFGEVK